MPPTPAETARTLAAGRLPGRLVTSAVTQEFPVPHVTTADGQVLIAARPGSRAWRFLAASGGGEAAVLTVDDVPPFPESPWLGRVQVGGWFERVADSGLRAARSAFAAASSLGFLPGLDLFRIEVGETWLDQREPVTVEPEEFARSAPDPLHPYERELLLDLREHHAAELAALMPPEAGPPLAVRLDQYGLVLATPELYRIEFPALADCPHCVAHALQLSHVGHP